MAGSTEAFTSAGTTIAISAGTPATINEAGYSPLTYTTIGEVTDAGEFGRTYNIVNHNPLATRGTVKLKGSFDDGTMQLQMAYAPGDAGQALLETALDDDDFYAFEVTLQDGTIKYFQAMVSANPTAIGGVDTVTGANVQLAIKSGTIVTVLPA
jgi:hypothetical protein